MFRVPVTTQEPITVRSGIAQRADRRVYTARLVGPGAHTITLPVGVNAAHITGIHLDILTSAVAGDRYPRIRHSDSASTLVGHTAAMTLIGTQATPASNSGYWSWQIGGDHLARSDAAIGYVETNGLPSNLYVDASDYLDVYFSNGNAADVIWLKVYYQVE